MTEKVREADAHSPTRWATGRITSLQPVDVRLGCGGYKYSSGKADDASSRQGEMGRSMDS